jgi:hypothetical protein
LHSGKKIRLANSGKKMETCTEIPTGRCGREMEKVTENETLAAARRRREDQQGKICSR